MKITAKQVPPEWQESPFNYADWLDMWPDIIITGNRDYNSHTTPEFDAIYDRFGYEEKCLLRALHLMTRKKYGKTIIRGNCQSDWQEVYYPVNDYTPEAIAQLETEYFNTGTEWIITSDDDPDGYSCYCYQWRTEDIRAEIAGIAGVSPEEVTLLFFDGWTQTPKYREV